MVDHFDVLQDLGSEVVLWFVAHVHDHSLLPVERYWHPSWLITLTFFRTQEVPRWFEEDLGSEVVFWFVAGRSGKQGLHERALFLAGSTPREGGVVAPSCSRHGAVRCPILLHRDFFIISD